MSTTHFARPGLNAVILARDAVEPVVLAQESMNII